MLNQFFNAQRFDQQPISAVLHTIPLYAGTALRGNRNKWYLGLVKLVTVFPDAIIKPGKVKQSQLNIFLSLKGTVHLFKAGSPDSFVAFLFQLISERFHFASIGIDN